MKRIVNWRYLRPASLIALTLLFALSACRPEFEDDPPIQLPSALKAYPGWTGSNGRYHYRLGIYKKAFVSSQAGSLGLKSNAFHLEASLLRAYPNAVFDSLGYYVFDIDAYDGQYWLEVWSGNYKDDLDQNSPYYSGGQFLFVLKGGSLFQAGESDPGYLPPGTPALSGFAYANLNGNSIELSFNAVKAFPDIALSHTFAAIMDSAGNVFPVDMDWVGTNGWVSASIDKSKYGNSLQAKFGTYTSLYTREYYSDFFKLP